MIKKNGEISEQVYELVTQIPMGKVATYGDIARVLGISPRYIGFILHNNPYEGKVPCHRVVNSKGVVAANFAFGGGDSQQKMLKAEGVTLEGNELDISRYRHNF